MSATSAKQDVVLTAVVIHAPEATEVPVGDTEEANPNRDQIKPMEPTTTVTTRTTIELESKKEAPSVPIQNITGEKSKLEPTDLVCYPDLLLTQEFLYPFLTLSALTLICFGIIRGMCSGNVPDNCSLSSSTLILQQLLACVERIFLVVAVGSFSFLIPMETRRNKSTLGYMILMLFIGCAMSAIVSGGLTDSHVRAGVNPLRIIVAIILILLLIPPLIYTLIFQNTVKQRLKALCVLLLYLIFLVANAGEGALHIHHWTWAFIFLIVHYPTIALKPAQTTSMAHLVMLIWSHVANMLALGILIEGLSAYGSFFFFISSPFSEASVGP